jgi:23S rRNA (uracil1939-C5)-methyltransferase/tRNA (uracil-5-)-methyltransferase
VSQRQDQHREFPFAKGTELELEITTLTNMAQGLGRVLLPDADDTGTGPAGGAGGGWVILVPFALPGERVRVRVWRNQKNFSDADLIKIITPSPHRIEPACPLFTRCGGCQYQNLDYAEQLRWKQRQVAELLQHMARVEFPVQPVIASPRAYGYRSKITPHFERPHGDRALHIGFLRQGSRHSIIDVERCPLATDAINARLAQERPRVQAKAAAKGFKHGATLLLRDSADGVTTDGAAIIRERVEGLDLRFPAGEFFQNNPFILEAFTRHVRERAVGNGATFLVDAYCGSGLFCLTAARAFEHATGIEVNEASIHWAKQNASANALTNCAFVAGDAANIFAQVAYPAADTAVVIDPPRKGSDEAFLQQLVRFGPRTVVYVSCNPATQMRDLTTLLASGYTLQDVQPFDLFPQTKHLECVITLTKG